MVLEKQLAKSHLREVVNEAKCMNILSHPNIPQLLGVQITCRPYSLIMEFIGQDAKSSTVHQMIEETSAKSSSLLVHEWVSVCVDITEAVDHIHSKGYLHCYLKTNNVLVFNKRGIVIDFGKACPISKPRAKKYNSFYHYIAPEVLQGRPVSQSSDVFSLGVIIFTVSKAIEDKSMYFLGKQCRDTKPSNRPAVNKIVSALKEMIKA